MSDQTGKRLDVLVGERAVERAVERSVERAVERAAQRWALDPASGKPVVGGAEPAAPVFVNELHSRLELVRTRVREEAVHLNQVEAVATEYLVSNRPHLRLMR
jgi:hypothetical protein